MKPVHELKMERHEKVTAMRSMLDKLDSENRKFTPQEQTRYSTLESELDALDLNIITAEQDLERRRKLAEKELGFRYRDVDPSREFQNIGEMLFALARSKRDHIDDPRLNVLRERREQVMGVGALGGFALPERFDSAIRQVQAEDAIVRPRCTVLPATDPPDSRLTFPTLDQTSQQGIYAGVQVTHGGEGTTLTETTAHLRQMSLEPKALGAYCVVSDKLLHNWSTCGAFITRQLAMAMSGQEDVDCLTGDGVNKSRGVLVSPAAISYSRATPNKIGFGDVLGMAARLLTRGGSPVWVANPTTIPELGAMTDSGSHAVWSGSRADALGGAAQKLPSTLLGFPVLFSTRVPPLGSRGDLSLLDLSFYLLLNGSGPFVASSEHVYFLSNRTVFRINWNFDGGSWLSEPIGMEADASQTTSPFIVLS